MEALHRLHLDVQHFSIHYYFKRGWAVSAPSKRSLNAVVDKRKSRLLKSKFETMIFLNCGSRYTSLSVTVLSTPRAMTFDCRCQVGSGSEVHHQPWRSGGCIWSSQSVNPLRSRDGDSLYCQGSSCLDHCHLHPQMRKPYRI